MRISVCLSSVGAVFYYRMDVLLPRGHFLNNKPARILFYSINYVLLPLVTFPAAYLAERQKKVTKYDLFMEHHVVYPDIFKKDVFYVVLDDRNPDGYFALIYYPTAVLYGVFLTMFTNYTIFSILKKHAVTVSVVSKKQHIEVIKALMILVGFFSTWATMLVSDSSVRNGPICRDSSYRNSSCYD